jgi:methionine synthase I (cobalamin-dependent)
MKRTAGIMETIKRKVVLCDGGMGSMLIAAGLKDGHPPEEWNISNPDKLTEIHTAYLKAGAEVIQTNTFGASRIKLGASEVGRHLDVGAVNEKGVEIARTAMEGAHGAGRFLAGELGPTGHFFAPIGTLEPAEARKTFKEQAKILLGAGVDFFFIETMYDVREAVEAVRAARELTDLPVFVELTFEKKPRGYFTLMGDDPEKGVTSLLEAGADVVGANCTVSSGDMIDLVTEMRQLTDTPIIFQPNAGQPEIEHGRTIYRQRPEEFAADIERMVEAGANAVGGCCGTTPAFIRAVHDALTHGR